jgi:hypothetical protein
MGTAETHATLRTGHKTRETKKDEKHGPHQETVVDILSIIKRVTKKTKPYLTSE